MRPFTTTDEAWVVLVEQRGMSDGEAVDLWELDRVAARASGQQAIG